MISPVNNPVAFYVPTRLDQNAFPDHLWPYAAYFLNLLHWKWICWQGDDNGFIRLKHKYITRIIPRAYWAGIRDKLVGRGIVLESRSFESGRKALGFKLAPNYWQVQRIVCTDDKINQRIQKVYREQNQLLPVHRWLVSKLGDLRCDMDQAKRIFGTLHPEPESKFDVDEYRDLLYGCCQRIADGEQTLSVDRFGRVHTPITRLARQLRPCLSVNGQKLVNLDLANSQPLIAGLVASEFYRSRSAAHRLRTRAFGADSNPYFKRKPKCMDRCRDDLNAYMQLCEQGKIYEHFGEDRERVKRMFLTAMYDKSRSRPSHLQDKLVREFPSVAFMLESFKAKDYRRAAHIMQNVESTLFIGCMVRRIMEERPCVPLFTIHDSLMTTPEHVGYVELVIREAFGRLGITPTIRIERYDN